MLWLSFLILSLVKSLISSSVSSCLMTGQEEDTFSLMIIGSFVPVVEAKRFKSEGDTVVS